MQVLVVKLEFASEKWCEISLQYEGLQVSL